MTPKLYDFSNRELFNFADQPAFRLIYRSLSNKTCRKKLEHQFNTVQKVVTEGEFIDKRTCEKLYEFSARLEPTKITTLHLAVMTGQYETAKKLLTIMKVNPNSADRRGWTPLHHAAILNNTPMIDLLIMNGAEIKDLTNDLGAAPVDFYKMVLANKLAPKEKIYQYTRDHEFEEITAEKFQEITGAMYLDHMLVTPETLAKSWVKELPLPKYDPVSLSCLKQYYDPKRDKQTLALQIEGRDETGQKVPIGPSVVAFRDIKKGELVCEILGKYTPSYVYGRNARNLGTMIHDGLPNTVCATINQVKGLPKRDFILASRDIKKGHPFTFDYRKDDIKLARFGKSDAEKNSLSNRYIEILPTTLETFLLNNSITEILLRDHISAYEISAAIYILTTPVVFMKHVLKGNISYDDLTLLQSQKFIKKAGLGEDLIFRKKPRAFQLEALSALMKTPERYTFIRSLLLSLLDRGYISFPSGILDATLKIGVEKRQDVEKYPFEDFIHCMELIHEFIEEGKRYSAIGLASDILSFDRPKPLQLAQRSSKEELRKKYHSDSTI